VSKEKRLLEGDAVAGVASQADRACYVGSIEHKTYPSPAGKPSPRHDASKCPRIEEARWPELTEALREAIRAGLVSDPIDACGLPRYVWGVFEGQLFEARRLSAPEDGYKAFPIEPFELPVGAAARLGIEGP
jgi:hypothetical protein